MWKTCICCGLTYWGEKDCPRLDTLPHSPEFMARVHTNYKALTRQSGYTRQRISQRTLAKAIHRTNLEFAAQRKTKDQA